MFEQIDLGTIIDEKTRELVKGLLNFIEQLSSNLCEARTENQRLRDENNRLKSEQGKPEIKGDAETPKDHSSKKERKKPRKRQAKKKTTTIVIDRKEVVRVDQAILPEDAIFKGYEENVVQDILLKTDNVCFLKEKYYSPSLGRTYLAELPSGYEGQFAPGIKALVLAFYHGGIPSGYGELDKRMATTLAHKGSLLLDLKFSELPLHNNPELGARGRVRKRDVSFGPRTDNPFHLSSPNV